MKCYEGCRDPLYAKFINVSKSLLCIQRGFWSLKVYNFFGNLKFEHLERQDDVVCFIQIPSNKFISAIQMCARWT